MKLIRVASPDQLTGLFSNEFSEAITLPPHSKIALLNGMFAMNSKSINVPTETTISFIPKVGADETTVTIPQGYYTQESLRLYLERELNFTLKESVMTPVCFAWGVAVGGNLLSLNFFRTGHGQAAIPTSNLVKLSLDSNIYTAEANSSTATVFKSYGYSDYTVLASNCELAIQSLDGAGSGARIKFMYGLLKNKPDSSTEGLSSSDFMYGMRYFADAGGSTGTAYWIVNGVEVSSSTAPDPGTLMKITFTNGEVQFGDTNLYSEKIAWVPEGYVYGLAIKSATNQLTRATLNHNPLVNQAISNGIHSMRDTPYQNILHIDESLGVGTAGATKVSVTLSDTAKAIMGFNENELAKQLVSGSFLAETALGVTNTPTSITVELPNLGGNIQSYDGISQKRRPIVAVVPAMNQSNGMLTYEPPYPPFIDLNNTFAIQLSKLEVRLLSSFDDTEVNLEHPGTTLTFALDHKPSQNPTGASTK